MRRGEWSSERAAAPAPVITAAVSPVSAGPPPLPDHSYRTTAQCDHTVTTVTTSLGESSHTTDRHHLQTQTELEDVKEK